MINLSLAEHRGIPRTDIVKIETLQLYRKSLESRMKELEEYDPEQMELFLKWKDNEYTLQSLWRFEINSAYHQDYLLHHCKCPTIDNHLQRQMVSSNRFVNKNCVYHGEVNK